MDQDANVSPIGLERQKGENSGIISRSRKEMVLLFNVVVILPLFEFMYIFPDPFIISASLLVILLILVPGNKNLLEMNIQKQILILLYLFFNLFIIILFVVYFIDFSKTQGIVVISSVFVILLAVLVLGNLFIRRTNYIPQEL